jgi:sulfur relay (sulfurtransferase) complex TusBCD TusD component (DsrE family)
MSSSLIDGKHYKQVVNDYYDDLIARLDVYAEERMEKIKDDVAFDKDENQNLIDKDRMRFLFIENHFIEGKTQSFRNPYSDEYKLDDESPVISNNAAISFKDCVHCERMRGVNEMKKLQKDRLEEIKMAKTKPTTIEEALFGGNKFGFLLEIDGKYFVEMGLKFRFLVVVVDFYLKTDYDDDDDLETHIKQIKYIIIFYTF